MAFQPEMGVNNLLIQTKTGKRMQTIPKCQYEVYEEYLFKTWTRIFYLFEHSPSDATLVNVAVVLSGAVCAAGRTKTSFKARLIEIRFGNQY